jgi:hypothetical protein
LDNSIFKLQNGNLDTFIDDCLNSLVFKDIETSKFLMKQLHESINLSLVVSGGEGGGETETSSISDLNSSRRFSVLSQLRPIHPTENSSENYFLKKEDCFHNMIQFDTRVHDSDFDRKFEFTFQKENLKMLGVDYTKWHGKLSEMENLMRVMLSQINEKRMTLVSEDDGQKENVTNLFSSFFFICCVSQK